MAFYTVKKQIKLLNELKVKTIGLIENMKNSNTNSIKSESEKLDINFIGEVLFDKTLEDSIGDSKKILKTDFYKTIKKIFQFFSS